MIETANIICVDLRLNFSSHPFGSIRGSFLILGRGRY